MFLEALAKMKFIPKKHSKPIKSIVVLTMTMAIVWLCISLYTYIIGSDIRRHPNCLVGRASLNHSSTFWILMSNVQIYILLRSPPNDHFAGPEAKHSCGASNYETLGCYQLERKKLAGTPFAFAGLIRQ